MSGSVPLKILFICSRNRIRSLTAERIFQGLPGIQARSAGTQENARVRVAEGHVRWADLIVCMEKAHLARLRMRFPDALEGKQLVALHIPDEFTLMQPELIDELETAMQPFLQAP